MALRVCTRACICTPLPPMPCAGAEVTALALSNAHVAVGTACGSVMAWQCEEGSEECKQVGPARQQAWRAHERPSGPPHSRQCHTHTPQVFVAKQVDVVPVRTVLLNLTQHAEGRLLVVHSAGRNSVNVWNLVRAGLPRPWPRGRALVLGALLIGWCERAM